VASTAPAALNLGFLMIVHEPSGYVGGYLVTNPWGRPLEFRLSTAVQPNRVQQILYGGTLEPYICADLIGKTLVDKTAVAAQLILTDCASALELRQRVEVPVAWLAPPEDTAGAILVTAGLCARPAGGGRPAVLCHRRYPGDVAAVKELLERLDGLVDPTEPFARIREAMGEARKMGVTKGAG
jgi:hypothetical protein